MLVLCLATAFAVASPPFQIQLPCPLCHIWHTAFYMQLGVGLNSKQRQRQKTDGFSCKLHLFTLELINTLYHNTWYHNLEENWRKILDKDPEEKTL